MAIIPNTSRAKQITQVRILSGATLDQLQANANAFLTTLNEDLEKNYLVTVGETTTIPGGFTLTVTYSYLLINISSADL